MTLPIGTVVKCQMPKKKERIIEKNMVIHAAVSPAAEGSEVIQSSEKAVAESCQKDMETEVAHSAAKAVAESSNIIECKTLSEGHADAQNTEAEQDNCVTSPQGAAPKGLRLKPSGAHEVREVAQDPLTGMMVNPKKRLLPDILPPDVSHFAAKLPPHPTRG